MGTIKQAIYVELDNGCKGVLQVDPSQTERWEAELRANGYDCISPSDQMYRYWRKQLPEGGAVLSSREDPDVLQLRLRHRLFMQEPLAERWVRPDIREAMDAWSRGELAHLGSFLEAVLEGNLTAAFGQADHYNQLTLGAITAYMYAHVPMAARGKDNMRAWQERALERLRAQHGTRV